MNRIKVGDVITIKIAESSSVRSAEIDVPIIAVSKRFNGHDYLIPNIVLLITSEYKLTEVCLLNCHGDKLNKCGLWGRSLSGEKAIVTVCSIQLCEDSREQQ